MIFNLFGEDPGGELNLVCPAMGADHPLPVKLKYSSGKYFDFSSPPLPDDGSYTAGNKKSRYTWFNLFAYNNKTSNANLINTIGITAYCFISQIGTTYITHNTNVTITKSPNKINKIESSGR